MTESAALFSEALFFFVHQPVDSAALFKFLFFFVSTCFEFNRICHIKRFVVFQTLTLYTVLSRVPRIFFARRARRTDISDSFLSGVMTPALTSVRPGIGLEISSSCFFVCF